MNDFWRVLCNLFPINNTLLEFSTTPSPPPPPTERHRLRPNREVNEKKELFSIFTVAGFPLPRSLQFDFNFLVYSTISIISQKGIIEVRNSLKGLSSEN
jgi:hypothetical protein